MYGKLFASLYQGTLRGRANEILVFTNLIAHADRDGFVDKHWRAISEEVGLSVDDVKAACSALEAPDPESRTNVAQGARIQRIDDHRAWGWKIVNYAKYRDIRNEEERRVQNRKAQERFREKVSAPVSNSKQPSASALTVSTVSNSKQPSAAVIIGQQPSAPSAHADVEVDVEVENTNTLPQAAEEAPEPPKRNLAWEALAALDGWSQTNPLTGSAGGRVGAALKDIKAACPSVTPEEIGRRVKNYRLRYPDAAVTSTAISANWALCDTSAQAPIKKKPLLL